MIREAIKKVSEDTKVLGHDIPLTDEQVFSFLKNKFGDIDELSSYTVVGNMIKMLFVVDGGSSSYTTEVEWVIKGKNFED